jgi:1-deoxy-D-xylulose-5-phosphate synthase
MKPIDEETILALAKGARGVLVIEENMLPGGFGERVRELLNSGGYSGKVVTLGLPDTFVEHGTQALLREEVGLTSSAVCAAVESLLASHVNF